jgi:ubiquinone/menaquinone biosynthesis C-methylase UbiE
MLTQPSRRDEAARTVGKAKRRRLFRRIVENDLISRVSLEEYQDKVRSVYGGPKGYFLAAASWISLHEPLGDRLLRTRKFDLRGVKSVLDVGTGAGQIARHVLKYADRGVEVTCCDLSLQMMRRGRARLARNGVRHKDSEPVYTIADLSRLPFADGSFDCVTCGYVLEHVPDPRQGLQEVYRVLRPGGRMLLFATEDSFSGAWTSRLWCCQTYNRAELLKHCQEAGLPVKQEIWFTRMHKVFRAGGICLELQKG